MADFQIREIGDSTGQSQGDIAREALASRTHPRQELGRYLRRGYQVAWLTAENEPLRDAVNIGRPGRVLLAAGGTLQSRFVVLSADGRPISAAADVPAGLADRDLTAAEQALLPNDPMVVLRAHPDLTLTLGPGAGVGQAITRLDGSAVPRADGEVGYRFQTGLGSVNNAVGVIAVVNFANVRGVGHVTIVRVAGSTGDVFVQAEVLANPLPAFGFSELRLAAAIP